MASVANYMATPKVKTDTQASGRTSSQYGANTGINPKANQQQSGTPTSGRTSSQYGASTGINPKAGQPQQSQQRLGTQASSGGRSQYGASTGINPQVQTLGGPQAQASGMPPGGVSPTRSSAPPTNLPQQSGQPSYTPSPFGGFNPTMSQNTGINPGAPAPRSGAQPFFNSTNPWNIDPDDAGAMSKLNALLPVAQFDQNNMQYQSDFNEAQRRWNAEFGATQSNNQFQQQLSTQQQQMAEWQAQQAAAQWAAQFGHTQNMDTQGMDLARQQAGNQFQMGMDQNQATRDVANTYSQAQIYGADQQLAGQLGSAGMYSDAQRYGSDQERIAAMYAADQGLAQAGLYSGAQMYGADQQLAGQLGSAEMYSDAQKYAAQLGLQEAQGYANAQRYGADQQLAGVGLQTQAQMYGANQQLAGTQYASDQDRIAAMYGADRRLDEAQLGLQGQLGSANIYGNAQMYGADQGFRGTAYQSDTERVIAAQQNQFLYAQLAQQAQQAELERQNMMRMTAMQTYGRSQAPQATWASAWS